MIVAPLLPPAKPGGRPRTTSLRGVLDAVDVMRASRPHGTPNLSSAGQGYFDFY